MITTAAHSINSNKCWPEKEDDKQTYSKIALCASILLPASDGGTDGLPNGMLPTGSGNGAIPS